MFNDDELPPIMLTPSMNRIRKENPEHFAQLLSMFGFRKPISAAEYQERLDKVCDKVFGGCYYIHGQHKDS